MRNTIRLKMTYDEVRVMVFALNELRNSLIAENRYTDAVDDIHHDFGLRGKTLRLFYCKGFGRFP